MKTIRPYLLIIFAVLFFTTAYAQTDTLFTNNQKIACVVKEITPDAVKYVYPGEEVINSVYKNSVEKIVFKSGRVQVFNEAKSYKPVNSITDFPNVETTILESEIQGLVKLGEVNAKAKGTTVYSSQTRVRDRAYKKLKTQAAMMGGNVILLTNQRSEGNKYNDYGSFTTETYLTGVAYSSKPLNMEDFKALLRDVKEFPVILNYEIGTNDSEFDTKDAGAIFTLTEVTNQNGVITLTGSLKGEKDIDTFQLASFNDKTFSLFYKKKNDYHNIVLTTPIKL